MILLPITRFLATLLSLAILAVAAYLLWTWQTGELVRDQAGVWRLYRDDWRLWTGLGLLAWSFLGRFITPMLCARPDRLKTKPERGSGSMVESPTGSTLYVERHGPEGAPPIIFTHGWGMDSTYWRYARHDLGDRFRLTLWDLPGLGESRPASKTAVSLEAFAADLASLVALHGGRKPVLVGHSIGGMIIQTLLRDQPGLQDRLGGVVLLNTTYTNPLRTMVFAKLLRALQRPLLEPAFRLTIALQPLVWLSQWQSYLSGFSHLAMRLGFGKFATRSQIEHAALLTTRNSPAVQARGNLAMVNWDATGALGWARIPVLVIGGDKDIVTKLEASEALQAQTERATLRVVEDVNHMGPMERADLYNQLIADFALHVQSGASDMKPMQPSGRDEPLGRRDPSEEPRRPNLH